MNKIDFALIISVKNCNPNGDPVNGNMPRQNLEGYGQISDVCLKRKIRNRLQDMGEHILNVSVDRAADGYYSIKARLAADSEVSQKIKSGTVPEIERICCEKWMDVRAFGQVIPFKKSNKAIDSGTGAAIGIKGCISIQMAQS